MRLYADSAAHSGNGWETSFTTDEKESGMGKKIKLTRQELIDIYTDVERERRADPGAVQASITYWGTHVVEVAARHAAEAFLTRLKSVRCNR